MSRLRPPVDACGDDPVALVQTCERDSDLRLAVVGGAAIRRAKRVGQLGSVVEPSQP